MSEQTDVRELRAHALERLDAARHESDGGTWVSAGRLEEIAAALERLEESTGGEALKAVDALVRLYAASTEPMTEGAALLAETVRGYVRQWSEMIAAAPAPRSRPCDVPDCDDIAKYRAVGADLWFCEGHTSVEITPAPADQTGATTCPDCDESDRCIVCQLADEPEVAAANAGELLKSLRGDVEELGTMVEAMTRALKAGGENDD